MKTRHYILQICTLLLITLWTFTGLDKFWNLEGFKRTLLNQPIPEWSVGLLYWLLPAMELLCIVLLVSKTGRGLKGTKFWGFVLSLLLMLSFTIFILLGVLGWYDQKPCGCGSVLNWMSWEEHLVFNGIFLIISVVGLVLSLYPSNRDDDGNYKYQTPISKSGIFDKHLFLISYRRRLQEKFITLWYGRKFALFPGQAGASSKL